MAQLLLSLILLYAAITFVQQTQYHDIIVRDICPAQCPIMVKNGNDQSYTPSQCNFIRDTYLCSMALPYLDTQVLTNCNESLVELTIDPVYLKNLKLRLVPRVNLNITISVTKQIDAVILQAECLFGYPNEALCFNKSRPAHWGGFYWPCKRYDLTEYMQNPQISVKFPWNFNFVCFHMESHSVFRINVTLLPQKCRLSYFVAMPESVHVIPYLHGQNAQFESKWTPLLSLDTSSHPHGVIFRVSKPPIPDHIRWITLELRQFSSENKGKLLQSHDLYHPFTDLGYRFENVEAGNYTAIAIVRNVRCVEMTFCPRIEMKFWLNEGRFTVENAQSRNFSDVTIPVGVAVLVSIFLVSVIVWLLACFIKYRHKHRETHISLIEMTRNPTLLLLYTDDNQTHRICVKELAAFLKAEANCNVLLDAWALQRPGVVPSEWLSRSVQEADFYAVVFSEGTRLAFQGIQLKGSQHWQDVFGPGVTYVLQALMNDCRSRPRHSGELLRKYVWIHFEHSADHSIEPFLSHLPCAQFELRKDLRKLLGHLHDVEQILDESAPINSEQLEIAIDNAKEYCSSNPDWLNDAILLHRESLTVELNKIAEDLARLAHSDAYQPQLGVEQQYSLLAANSNAHNDFGLVAPDGVAMVDGEKIFQVVGSPDDLSDSDEGELLLK